MYIPRQISLEIGCRMDWRFFSEKMEKIYGIMVGTRERKKGWGNEKLLPVGVYFKKN